MGIEELVNKADNYTHQSVYTDELIQLIEDYNDFYAGRSGQVDVPDSITNYSMYGEGDEVIHEFYGMSESSEGHYTVIESGNKIEVTVQ